jgi:uncharacterized protein (TIGR00369 family)
LVSDDFGVRIWEEPYRGSFGDASSLALPGVERMRSVQAGRSNPPPIHHLTGIRPVEAAYGSSTFAMPVTPWLQTTVPGLLSGGVLAFLADAPLGGAIMSVLPPLRYMTTTDLSMSFLRPAGLESGTLVGKARLIHGGKAAALSEVSIEDGNGRQLAHGTSRGFLLTAPAAPPAGSPRPDPRVEEAPDPYLRRPVAGRPIDFERWGTITGLEALQGCIAGPDAPPISHLTGLRPTEAGEGTCTFVLPATPWLASPSPVLYGGAIALLADAALFSAVMTTIGPGESFAPLDLKVSYVRPVIPDGRLMTARARLAHRGRSMAVATAELFNEDGKKIALATSSAMLLARPWSEIAGVADREVAAPSER